MSELRIYAPCPAAKKHAIREAWAGLCTRHGAEAVPCVVSREDVALGVMDDWAMVPRELLRVRLGEETWARCRTEIAAPPAAMPKRLDAHPEIQLRIRRQPRPTMARRAAQAIARAARAVAGWRAMPPCICGRSRSGRERVRSFLEAVSGPLVEGRTRDARLAICQRCECVHHEAGKLYCRACGCRKWALAELRTKLFFARLECPCDPPRWRREIAA